MLVLSRKRGESILIGDDVVLVVQQIRGNRVQLGIVAPENVMIRRGELPPQAKWFPETLPVSPHVEPPAAIEGAIL